jgi:hypothetical protein
MKTLDEIYDMIQTAQVGDGSRRFYVRLSSLSGKTTVRVARTCTDELPDSAAGLGPRPLIPHGKRGS